MVKALVLGTIIFMRPNSINCGQKDDGPSVIGILGSALDEQGHEIVSQALGPFVLGLNASEKIDQGLPEARRPIFDLPIPPAIGPRGLLGAAFSRNLGQALPSERGGGAGIGGRARSGARNRWSSASSYWGACSGAHKPNQYFSRSCSARLREGGST